MAKILKRPYGFLVSVQEACGGESRFSFVESEVERGAYQLATPRGPGPEDDSRPSPWAQAQAVSAMRAEGRRIVMQAR